MREHKSKLSCQIDKVAESLESKGFLKIAKQLDVISNDVEAVDMNKARTLRMRMLDLLRGKFKHSYGQDEGAFNDDAESAMLDMISNSLDRGV